METGGNVRRHGCNSAELIVQYPPHPFRRRIRETGGERQAGGRYRELAETKHTRPRSAKPQAPSSRGRPARASSAAKSVQVSRDSGKAFCNNSKGKCVNGLNKCPGEDCCLSADPVDFDSSISAICNLPVGLFVGAARGWWDCNFRNLRTRGAHERLLAERGHFPGSRAIQSKPEQEIGARQRRLKPGNVRGGSGPRRAAVGNKRRIRDLDGLAGSRGRTTKRLAEKEVIRRLTRRVQILWQELRVPRPDRAYVFAAYLGGGPVGTPGTSFGLGGEDARPTSDEVRDELVRQITLLLKYRTATIKVLRCIASRESWLDKVEQALQAFQWHRGRDIDAPGAVNALAGLRDASLHVVRAVLEWRNNLWQPRAFCWRGVNYLEKMSHDTTFLCSPVGRGLLASVGLGVDDMTLVVYSSVEEDEDRALERKPFKEELSDVRSSRTAPVRLKPKAELVEEYRALFFGQSSGIAEGGDFRRIGSEERARIVKVVMKEAALQRHVQAELEHLAAKGCFVPLLRWMPIGGASAQDGKRRASSRTSLASCEPGKNSNKITRKKTCTSALDVEQRDHRPPSTISKSTTTPWESELKHCATQALDSDSSIKRNSTWKEPEGGSSFGKGRDQAAHDYQGRGEDQGVFEDEQSKQSLLEEDQTQVGQEEQGTHERGTRRGRGRGGQEHREEENHPLHKVKGHQTSAGFDRSESCWHYPGDTVTVKMVGDDGKNDLESPRFQNRTWGANTSHFDSRYSLEQTASTPQDQREDNHMAHQLARGIVNETALPRSSETADTSERVELAQAPDGVGMLSARTWRENEEFVVSSAGDTQPDVGRYGVDHKKRVNETLRSDACDTGRIYLRRETLGIDSENREYKSLESVQGSTKEEGGPSRSREVARVDDGCGDEITHPDAEVLPSDCVKEDDVECGRSVSKSLMYDDDFESEGKDLSFAESERKAICHQKVSLSGGKQEVNTKDEFANTEADDDYSVREGEDARNDSDAFIIQRAWRRMVARKEKEGLRRNMLNLENAAAKRIQQAVKTCSTKKQIRLLREEYITKEECAKKLQTWMTAWRVKRDEKLCRMQTDTARKIQSAVKGEHYFDEARELRCNWEARSIGAAVRIQTLVRRRKAQAICAESRKAVAGEKRTPSPLWKGRAFDESTSERNEHEGEVTRAAEENPVQRSESGKGGVGPSSLEKHPSECDTETTANDRRDSWSRDGLCIAPAPASQLSEALPSTDFSTSLTNTSFRSSSSVSGSQSFTEGSSLDDSSSRTSSDNLNMFRAMQRSGQRRPGADNDLGRCLKINDPGVEKYTRLSKRLEDNANDKDASKVQAGVVTTARIEDAPVMSTTALGVDVDDLPGNAVASSMLLHDSDRGDLANPSTAEEERDTAVVLADDAVLVSATNNVVASSPEYSSGDMGFDTLSSSSKSSRSGGRAVVSASGKVSSVNAENSSKNNVSQRAHGARDVKVAQEFPDSDDSFMTLSDSDSN